MAVSLTLTEKDVKWQFVQELLFVFSACRSVKHDERASYGDMALEAWECYCSGAGARRGSCEGLGATCEVRQGRIATSLFVATESCKKKSRATKRL